MRWAIQFKPLPLGVVREKGFAVDTYCNPSILELFPQLQERKKTVESFNKLSRTIRYCKHNIVWIYGYQAH